MNGKSKINPDISLVLLSMEPNFHSFTQSLLFSSTRKKHDQIADFNGMFGLVRKKRKHNATKRPCLVTMVRGK